MLAELATHEENAGFTSSENRHDTPIVTIALIGINIIVFAAMILAGANFFSPDPEMLLSWGASLRYLTYFGGWWRLLTSCFLHSGILHLGFNLYALAVIGAVVEWQLGPVRYAFTYLLAGIAGGVASIFWHATTVSVGASGAIFGLCGVLFALFTTNLFDESVRAPLLRNMAIVIGLNLFIGLTGPMDNAAHIGGLVAGVIMGYVYYPSLLKPEKIWLRYLSAFVSTAGILTLVVYAFSLVPEAEAKASRAVERVATLENVTLDYIRNAPSMPPSNARLILNAEILPQWRQVNAEVGEIDTSGMSTSWRRSFRLVQQLTGLYLEYFELTSQAYAAQSQAVLAGLIAARAPLEAEIRRVEERIKEQGFPR